MGSRVPRTIEHLGSRLSPADADLHYDVLDREARGANAPACLTCRCGKPLPSMADLVRAASLSTNLLLPTHNRNLRSAIPRSAPSPARCGIVNHDRLVMMMPLSDI